MTNDLDDMVSSRGPRVIEDARATRVVGDFFAIHENLSLSARNRPNDHDLMFFATRILRRPSRIQRLLVGKSKSPGGAENNMLMSQDQVIPESHYLRRTR